MPRRPFLSRGYTNSVLLVKEVASRRFVPDHVQDRPAHDVGWNPRFCQDSSASSHTYSPGCLRSHSHDSEIKGLKPLESVL